MASKPRTKTRRFDALSEVFEGDDTFEGDEVDTEPAPESHLVAVVIDATATEDATEDTEPAAAEPPVMARLASVAAPALEVTESGSTEPPEVTPVQVVVATPPVNGLTAGSPASALLVSTSAPADRPMPKSLVMDRKEVRLFPDQRDDLDALEKRLNRARGSGNGERITANSLIRIAIDLLLERKDVLVGISEDDLRAAVGLPGRSVPVEE